MAIPASIKSLNSYVQGWLNGVDDDHSDQPGRSPQPASMWQSSTSVEVVSRATLSSSRTVIWEVHTAKALGGGAVYWGGTSDTASLRWGGSAAYVYAGGSNLISLGFGGDDHLNETVRIVLTVHSDGSSHVATSVTSSVISDPINSSALAVSGDSLRLPHVAVSNSDCRLVHYSEYSVDVLSTQIKDIADNAAAVGVEAHVFYVGNPGGFIDLSANTFPAFVNVGQSYNTGGDLFNANGYSIVSNADARLGALVPKDSVGALITDGLVGDLVFSQTFSGPVRMDLDSYQQPQRYKRFVDAGDGGFYENSGALNDISGSLYFGTQKANLNQSLPYQKTYAPNLVSWSDDGVNTVILDASHADFSSDVLALQTAAGIGALTYSAPNIESGTMVVGKLVADGSIVFSAEITTSDGWSRDYTHTADRDIYLEFYKAGKLPIRVLTTLTASGGSTPAQQQEDFEYNMLVASGKDPAAIDNTKLRVGGQADRVELLVNSIEGEDAYVWTRWIEANVPQWAESEYAGTMDFVNAKYSRLTSDILIDNVSGVPAVWTGMSFRRIDGVSLLHSESSQQIDFQPEYLGFIDSHSSLGASVDKQDIADAMAMAPTEGTAVEEGSVLAEQEKIQNLQAQGNILELINP